MRVVCVLRSGGDFESADVAALRRGVQRYLPWAGFFCISDVPVLSDRVRLEYDWPGWWAKMAVFDPEIRGDLLYVDLDTVPVGDLNDVASVRQTTMLSDFYFPATAASGLMYLREEDRKHVWDYWIADPADRMGRFGKGMGGRAMWGDQALLRSLPFGQTARRWQTLLPGQVVSYKVHCRRTETPPAGARVVCYHGKPRPRDTRLWAKYQENEHVAG